jgi:hypothetical protein
MFVNKLLKSFESENVGVNGDWRKLLKEEFS